MSNMRIISPTPAPPKLLITSLYGQPIDPERSREHREASATYMADYFKTLIDYIDQLSHHTADGIDAMHVNALRNNNCKEAITVYAWHGLFAPYRMAQTPYLNGKRLRQLAMTDGDTAYELATFVAGSVNAELYDLLMKLNPKHAADFFKHSLMYAYEHTADKDVVAVCTIEQENTNGLPVLSSDNEAVSWGNLANEGDQ